MHIARTTGRRKTSVARVYFKNGKGEITVNKKALNDYFPTEYLQKKIARPLEIAESLKKYDITVLVHGGGVNGQAEAVVLGIAKILVEIDAEIKPKLKEEKLLTRDSRMVERKKPGRKKARKRFQFSKR